MKPCPNRANNAVMNSDVGIITKEDSGVGKERGFTDLLIEKCIAAIFGYSEIDICPVTFLITAIIKNKIEIAISLIDRHPGEELLLPGTVIVDSNGCCPRFTFIGGFRQPDIGVVTSIALIGPVDV